MEKVWKILKTVFMTFFISTWYVWIAVILATITGLIFGLYYSIWVFFGLVGAVIVYVWLRQIYWWFTGKVDFEGKGFPKLWDNIFK